MMKKVLLAIISIFIIALFSIGILYINNRNDENTNSVTKKQEKKEFGKYVKTIKDATLYKKEGKNYKSFGIIGKNNELELNEKTSDREYLNIINSDYYISYKAIESIEALSETNNRFKQYIPFNENIITDSQTTFTDENGLFITYNKSFDLPIIIKEDNSYGVELNNKLYYVNKDNVKEIRENINSTEKKKDKIITLTYHFLYDPETDNCNQSICQSLEQFESHLKYIKENNYLTLQLSELEMFLDKKINLPYNSLVITIDDGTMFNLKAIDLLEKYEQYATLFVITGWVENLEKFSSAYLALESHTDLMHNQYECKGMGLQGGGILCKDEEYVLNDLKTSQEKVGGSKYFAYPFFDHNERAIELLKKAGFNMAFVGQYNTNGFSTPGKTDKYKVPRKTIFNSTSMAQFKELLK